MSSATARYARIRRATESLCAPLEIEDHVVQPMEDVSPPKWHLGHTTWFFETFLLERWEPGYRRFDEAYPGIFNSYYQSLGRPYPRARRGTLSRPTVRQVRAYREAVDEAMERLIERGLEPDATRCLELGLNHEQQHQELLIADIKCILSHNRPRASYPGGAFDPPPAAAAPSALRRIAFDGGTFLVGHGADGFAFDNEGPPHAVVLRPFALGSRLVTRGEYQAFIDAGGYADFRHWLSDGWERVQLDGWSSPLYWDEPAPPSEPVCHLSYYEADAFARWAGGRLPTEAEWELAAAAAVPESGRFMDDGRWRPAPAPSAEGVTQLFGDVWEWTSSAYGPYPGYRPAAGALGEYNGKFMSNQLVLRGGSCATPRGHVRRTYRNFFQPEKRWQFMGLRLAWDA